MVADQSRCKNCGTPLTLEDVKCPACGAPVDAERDFPSPESFVDVSYQNVEIEPDVAEETVIVTDAQMSTPPEVIDIQTDDVTPGYSSTGGLTAEQINSTYTSPQSTGGNTAMRTCLITCAVLLIVGLCCLIIFAGFLWVAGDFIWSIINNIFGSIQFY